MSGLAALQRALQQRVLDGDVAIEAFVRGTESFPARARLGVYEHAYRARLCAALAQNHPALAAALGAETFGALARDYAAFAPSRRPSIRWFGDRLADFLTLYRLPGAGRGPADLARFEWALGLAFDAADAAPLDKAALAALPPGDWPGLVLRLHPSVRRVATASNAIAWWRASQSDAARPRDWQPAAPVPWLVWRQDLTQRFRSLPEDEARALDAVAAGQSLAAVCEQLAAVHAADQVGPRLVALLHEWFDAGLVVGLQGADPP